VGIGRLVELGHDFDDIVVGYVLGKRSVNKVSKMKLYSRRVLFQGLNGSHRFRKVRKHRITEYRKALAVYDDGRVNDSRVRARKQKLLVISKGLPVSLAGRVSSATAPGAAALPTAVHQGHISKGETQGKRVY